jgi:DNA-binding IclR family transcriptional regulator
MGSRQLAKPDLYAGPDADSGVQVHLGPMPQTSAGKALEVLDLFGGPHLSLGVSEVALALAVPKSTAHRLLKILVKHGFIHQLDNRRYFLTSRMFQLSNQSPASKPAEVRARAGSAMGQLFLRTRESVQLAVLTDDHVLYVDRIQGNTALAPAVGALRPAYCTATGRALLAFAPSMIRERLAGGSRPRLTTRTRVGRDLDTALADVRRQGYAAEVEEFLPGIACLAAPIFDERGKPPIAAISVTRRIVPGIDIRCHAAAVVEAARRIRIRAA